MNRSQVSHDIRFLKNRLKELEEQNGIGCYQRGKLGKIKTLKRLLKYIRGYALYELEKEITNGNSYPNVK